MALLFKPFVSHPVPIGGRFIFLWMILNDDTQQIEPQWPGFCESVTDDLQIRRLNHKTKTIVVATIVRKEVVAEGDAGKVLKSNP